MSECYGWTTKQVFYSDLHMASTLSENLNSQKVCGSTNDAQRFTHIYFILKLKFGGKGSAPQTIYVDFQIYTLS